MTRAEFLSRTADMPPLQRKAAWVLQKQIECASQSYRIQDYSKRREAALKHTRGCA